MGDLLMSSPAIRALKTTLGARITVLTSSMASTIARHITEIDEVIIYDLPWIKAADTVTAVQVIDMVSELKNRKFDAAVVFSVYSQNPLPAAMLAYLSGIPLRLAYCRENPYDLLTHWVPDKEPYTLIKHQVRRDLDLVASIGAHTPDENILIENVSLQQESAQNKLARHGVDLTRPWLILHPGVSEAKREYPFELWVKTAKEIIDDLGYQVLFTGGAKEKALTDRLKEQAGENAFSLAGIFNLDEFIAAINMAPLIVSVNTGTVHLAAATQTPVIVLYALTNPQHFPWKVRGKVLTFDVDDELKSRNEVIKYVNETYFNDSLRTVKPEQIIQSIKECLSGESEMIPELPENVIKFESI
jgi:lipopolysaccharide heptosyltransferase II